MPASPSARRRPSDHRRLRLDAAHASLRADWSRPSRPYGNPATAVNRKRRQPRLGLPVDTFPRVRCAPMAPLSLDELRAAVGAGRIDTVLLCLADMQGRLQGKRLTARHFLDEVRRARRRGVQLPARRRRRDEHRRRLRDVLVGARLRRLRDEARLRHAAARPVARGHRAVHGRPALGATARPSSPRRARSCARQLDRLAERGLDARSARPSWSSSSSATPTTRRRARGYRDLHPANLYNVDYSMLGTSRVEPLIRRIRNGMAGAGMRVENSKGECNFGQHEINFGYGPVLQTADEHAIYKNGAKEIADQEGMAITFMAKFDEREGNSCHIHLSLAARRTARRCSPTTTSAFERFLAGQLACLRGALPVLRAERQLLQALRGRLVRARPRSPGARTTARARCASSATAPSRRIECRLPGADVNPYLAMSRDDRRRAARDRRGAGARARVRGQRLHVGQAARARARCATPATRSPPAPSRATRSARRSSTHYLNNATVELDAFEAAVTDWERVRGFERL